MISFPLLSRHMGVFIFVSIHFLPSVHRTLLRIINNLGAYFLLSTTHVQAILILQQDVTFGQVFSSLPHIITNTPSLLSDL
jgi:hypothetical protein